MDENDDPFKAIYKDSSKQETGSLESSPTLQDENVKAQSQQSKQNIVTKIVYSKESIPLIDEFVKSCQNEIQIITDKNGASLIINNSEFTRFFTTLKDNSIIIKIITEIDRFNKDYCKQMMDRYNVDLRHFSDITFNHAISDGKEYAGFTVSIDDGPFSNVIYSNIKEIVNQNKFIFDTLWKKSTPIEQRIKEIEEGLLPLETYMIDSQAEALSYTKNFINNAEDGFSNSTSIEYFRLLEHNETLLQSYLQYLTKHKEGKVNGCVKWITFINDNDEDVNLIRRFLDLGVEIRHVQNLPPLFFSVSQKQCVVISDILPNGEMFQKIIHSTEPLYISHYRRVFEKLWKTGLDASERIRQIKTGTTLATTKIIENSADAKSYFIEMIRNAKEEILILFPTLNAIKREVIMGIIDLLQRKGAQNVQIRVLSPENVKVKEIVLSSDSLDKYLLIQNITSREIRKQNYLISTLVIVDRKIVLATELKDDTKESFEEAIGLSTYSTSKPAIFSYLSIFESLWDQTEMYENIKTANEKLIHSEQLEREFINTAAHELRTPTQAMMGYMELDKEIIDDLLKNEKVISDKELKMNIQHISGHYDAISRNSARLNSLIDNLLDVARIESSRTNSLQIHKEKLDLVKEINDTIRTQFGQKIKDKEIQINFINDNLDGPCWVYADKLRINQILNNLLGNSIKFTNQNGKIDILINNNSSSVERKLKVKNNETLDNVENKGYLQEKKENDTTEQILVGISDTGRGIPSQIMSRLFEKFVTGSDTGTGLGLYITRNLIEAHGGRIWAFNNSNGIGATFVFSLPKPDDQNSNYNKH